MVNILVVNGADLPAPLRLLDDTFSPIDVVYLEEVLGEAEPSPRMVVVCIDLPPPIPPVSFDARTLKRGSPPPAKRPFWEQHREHNAKPTKAFSHTRPQRYR